MNIELMQFQLKAIKDLLDAMEAPCRDIILKSPTGSGKTIILTHFMDEYMQGHLKTEIRETNTFRSSTAIIAVRKSYSIPIMCCL